MAIQAPKRRVKLGVLSGHVPWKTPLITAGVGQLVLISASLAIPRVLRWPEDVARLRPLTRQLFWTYAGYIWATNLSFGLISTFAPGWLLDGTPLTGAVCGFIATYWGWLRWLPRLIPSIFGISQHACPAARDPVLDLIPTLGIKADRAGHSLEIVRKFTKEIDQEVESGIVAFDVALGDDCGPKDLLLIPQIGRDLFIRCRECRSHQM